jgi:hypothetical protein
MKDKEESREIHCREVREIMEKKPGWIISWGTMIISLLVLAAVLLCWRLFW